MKKIIIILCFYILNSSLAISSEEKLALGLMVGNPIAINGKKWIDSDKAIDGAVGVSPGSSDWEGTLHSDYLWHRSDFLYFNETHPLDLYYGAGARMEFSETIELGIRLPAGVVWKVPEQKAEVFGEAAPILDFLGKFGMEMSIGFGARYYF